MNLGLCFLGTVMYFMGCVCLGVATKQSNHWTWSAMGLLFFGGMVIGVALP